MNGHFYFEIQADDTHRAVDFYKEVLIVRDLT
jgi:predicted enzyme related to lactoylglutathione lyase